MMGVSGPVAQTIIIRIDASKVNETGTIACMTTSRAARTSRRDLREGRTDARRRPTRDCSPRCASNPLRTLGLPRSITIAPIRQGFPEVILGLGKTPDQIAAIAARIVDRGHPLLVTRADEAAWQAVSAGSPRRRVSRDRARASP